MIPSSHLLSIDKENWQPIVDPDGDPDAPVPTALSPGLTELKLTSPVGKPRAIMIHYDMLHRGTGRLVEESPDAPWRPMFKFQFMRTQEPCAPSHDSSGAVPTWPDSPLAPAWQSQWEWLHGAAPGSMPCNPALPPPGPDAIFSTDVGAETERVGAAYSMAREGDVQGLQAALLAGEEAPRRAATYGLCAAGDAAVPALLEQLTQAPSEESSDPSVRSAAAFALGECASPTLEVIGALRDTLDAAKARLRGEQGADLFSGTGATTGPGAQPGDVWAEIQVVGQAVYCLANKLATTQHLAEQSEAEREVLGLACELLQSKNAAMLPPQDVSSSSDDIAPEPESQGAVSNTAPGLRRHGVHALLALTACSGGASPTEWRRQLTDAAMEATRDVDRYVQQPAWQALQRLSQQPEAEEVEEVVVEQEEEEVEMSAADKLIERLVDLRMCPVTATGSGF